MGSIGEVLPLMAIGNSKLISRMIGDLRAFWDYLVLFSGISTASNLSRTQRRPVRRRGVFLFRSPVSKN